ncbi:MAG: type II toxin-antitoxin system RelE/ParE family toxin [Aliihoeflea sp.]
MTRYLLRPAVSAGLEEIYRHTVQQFGSAQADAYLDGMFALFEDIVEKRIGWQRIPSEYGVEGYFARYKSHFVFWKRRDDGDVAIVAILHQRMDIARRLRDDASGP